MKSHKTENLGVEQDQNGQIEMTDSRLLIGVHNPDSRRINENSINHRKINHDLEVKKYHSDNWSVPHSEMRSSDYSYPSRNHLPEDIILPATDPEFK